MTGPQSLRRLTDSLYELMPFPVIVTDAEARHFILNDAGRRALGWEGKADAAEPLGGLLPEADLPQLLQGYSVAGRAHSHAIRFRRADGSELEALAHVIGLCDGEEAGGYALLLRSLVMGGSHGEQVLLGSRIYSALDTIPEGVAIFDREDRILVYNRAFREGCGPARDSVRVGATLESIVRANIRDGNYAGLQAGTPEAEEVLERRVRHHREHDGMPDIFQRGDGRWIRSESHVTDSGEVVGLRIDITDLKTVEQELDARQRRYATLLQLLPDQIVRTDGNLVIQFANERYAGFRGTTPEALIGTSLRDLAATCEERAALSRLLEMTPDVPIITVDSRETNVEGEERRLFWSAIASFEEGKPIEFVAVGRDMTEVRRQHERLAEQAEELQRKNEALNQFAATVSHDLKAPIRHIASFTEMIVDDVEEAHLDDLATHAAYVRHAALRMQKLVERLLEYAQIAYEIRHVETVSLDKVVADALSILADHVREAGAEIELAPLASIQGDPELLRRLMQNLIGNAIKYRHPGTVPKVRVRGEATDDAVRVIVEDEGIGIDPKHADQIFELFQRLHQDEKTFAGTGIGLTLAERIVRSHGGTIRLDTDYRSGARFVVVFPKGELPR